MPANFLTVIYYVLGIALALALLAAVIAVGFTVFVMVFTYVFIPLLIIAGIRWVLLQRRLNSQERITYHDDK